MDAGGPPWSGLEAASSSALRGHRSASLSDSSAEVGHGGCSQHMPKTGSVAPIKHQNVTRAPTFLLLVEEYLQKAS